MKVFTRDYKISHINSPVFGEYYSGLKSCVLDIEATGLDPRNAKVVLMGLLIETDTGLKITQFLAENHYEEDKVLKATIDFLKDNKIDYLITFNGLRYDIPFINTRLNNLFIESQIEMYDFDLYRFLRKCSNLPKKLDSLSQSSVENYFGIAPDRKDTITGRENIALFNEYSVSGNSTVEKIILTHNREDVLQLYKLLKLCSANEFADILDTDFHTAIASYGFPVDKCKYSARPVLSKSKKLLRISGDQNYSAISAAYFPDFDRIYTATFNSETKLFEIEFPVSEKDSNYFIDLKKLGISIADDPDVVNDFLVLNPRTINMLSVELLSQF